MTTNRITNQDLENLVSVINEMTGNPAKAYDTPNHQWNVGAYQIASSYGKVQLERISNEAGGVSLPLGYGLHTKAELHQMLYAFIQGLSVAKVSA